MKIYEIIALQNTIKKLSRLNFNSTKKSYEAYKILKTYNDSMVFFTNEIEKIKLNIDGFTTNKDGSFNIPKEKQEEFNQKLNEFCSEEFELIKEKIDLNMEDIFEAGQAVDDKYKINAEDFDCLEKLFQEIRRKGNKNG